MIEINITKWLIFLACILFLILYKYLMGFFGLIYGGFLIMAGIEIAIKISDLLKKILNKK